MDLSTGGSWGPAAFGREIVRASSKYQGECLFVATNIALSRIREDNNPRHFFWISAPPRNSLLLEALHFRTSMFKRTIFGPNLIPRHWPRFPDRRSSIESQWSLFLSGMYGYVVHSERVRNYLMSRSRTEGLAKKYMLAPGCAYESMDLTVPVFVNRSWDILLFEKYADRDMRAEGSHLYALMIRDHFSVIRVRYGKFNRRDLEFHGMHSRFIVYFSFYDTGAIAFLELQNLGGYSFSFQAEFLQEQTGSFVPALESNVSEGWVKIRSRIREIALASPNCTEYARLNRRKNSCLGTLNVLCQGVKTLGER
jgi:hypothetical protein